MSTTIPSVTPDTLHELIASSEVPVLVDFTAPACHPCAMVLPVLAEIAAERAGTLQVVKINVHLHPEVGRRHGVMGTPTLVLFRDGEPVRRVVGARGKAYLLEAFAEVLV